MQTTQKENYNFWQSLFKRMEMKVTPQKTYKQLKLNKSIIKFVQIETFYFSKITAAINKLHPFFYTTRMLL